MTPIDVSRLLVFAGPNGSGKSTITTPENLAAFGVAPDRYINADEIARALLETLPNLTQEEREHIAFRQARDRRKSNREQGESFAFETVFSHPSTLLDICDCRDAGFLIAVLFVTTDNAETNVTRVAERVRTGGHDVPTDRIRARYERTMRLLPRIVEDADRAYVFDNTDKTVRVFPYRAGRAENTTDTLPDFLQTRLVKPLRVRKHERARFAATFGESQTPDEGAGEYAGLIVEVGTQYFWQEAEGATLRHDRLLFADAPGDAQTVMVRYKDGTGVFTVA